MVYYLFFMLSNQTLKYKSDWSMKFYGMPSGVIVTLMLNSIQNSIMYRVAFGKVTSIPLRHFKKHVRLATVGDDNVAGILDCNFSMIAAKEVYDSYGYVVTPASKGGVFVDDLTLEELQFVKRRFVYYEEDARYRAPLELDSIYKALAYHQKIFHLSLCKKGQNVLFVKN